MSERYQLVSADSELLNGQKTKLVNEKNELTRLISDLNNSLIQNTQEKKSTTTNLNELRETFKSIQAEVYTVGVCPTCKRAYDEDGQNSEV